MSSAPASWAMAAAAAGSSMPPKKLGCAITTAAVCSPTAARSAARSVRPPPSSATTTGAGPSPWVSVVSTWRYSGCTPAETTMAPPGRLLCAAARMAASASAVAPSYMEALLTSRPVSSQIAVWYSKMVCSTPWLRSA